MRWQGQRQSDNVEDRRGSRATGVRRGGSLGIGAIVVALLASWLFGINPVTMLGILEGVGDAGSPPAAEQAQGQRGPIADEGGQFVSVVLASTEDVWRDIFRQASAQYEPPRLVVFDGRTSTACGAGQSASGPFYCPLDRAVYIDLSFYRMLRERFSAPGDFAQAYVIAHEVGHHVQNLAGTMSKVQSYRERASERQSNLASVRLELQADCYAGVWAHHSQRARSWLERGDVEEGLNAASQIGDDKMQMRSQGVVVPDGFTHGSGAQRVHWFGVGMKTGQLSACDTFAQATP